MKAQSKRVEALEQREGGPRPKQGRPFLWGYGETLAHALAWQGLTLDDKPLFAIRLVGAGEVPDPIFERDRHLLGC